MTPLETALIPSVAAVLLAFVGWLKARTAKATAVRANTRIDNHLRDVSPRIVPPASDPTRIPHP